MLERTIARIEAFIKGMAFDCHACGQCVLRQTGLICPMSCPKGLRNGPCGGTLHGECEVYPDRPCVWIRIQGRTSGRTIALPQLLPSPDARLHDTSSYLNMLRGTDQPGRTPLKYLELASPRVEQPPQTASALERGLKKGWFARTCEMRAPRRAAFEQFDREAANLSTVFDAINITAYLNGKPSLPSAVGAARLAQRGITAICQSTCRDHTKTSFVSELVQNQVAGVDNVLCLTGDSYAGVPKIKQVFDMDSSLMIYEARHLRERGMIHFTGEKMADPPRLFLGAAINPYTEPAEVPIRRLLQKAAAGADFIQTQVIFDLPRFASFMEQVCAAGIHRELFILAGVPVVTSRCALEVLPTIPGIHLPSELRERLRTSPDIAAVGVELARKTVHALYEMTGVSGVHLMLLGPDHGVLPRIIADLPRQRHGFTAAASVSSSPNPQPRTLNPPPVLYA